MWARALPWLAAPAGTSNGRDRWTGVSIVASGFGGSWQTDRFAPQAGLGLRVDSLPVAGLPLLIGAEIGDRRSLLGPPDIRTGSRQMSGPYADLRAGWSLGDRWMIYGTTGLWQHQRVDRRSATGWSAGAGLSYALDDAWAATIDYRFMRAPNGRGAQLSGTRHVHDDASVLLGGVTYRFLGL